MRPEVDIADTAPETGMAANFDKQMLLGSCRFGGAVS
jgi:hypothetical protein